MFELHNKLGGYIILPIMSLNRYS